MYVCMSCQVMSPLKYACSPCMYVCRDPTTVAGEPMYRIVRVVKEECRVRCPFLSFSYRLHLIPPAFTTTTTITTTRLVAGYSKPVMHD